MRYFGLLWVCLGWACLVDGWFGYVVYLVWWTLCCCLLIFSCFVVLNCIVLLDLRVLFGFWSLRVVGFLGVMNALQLSLRVCMVYSLIVNLLDVWICVYLYLVAWVVVTCYWYSVTCFNLVLILCLLLVYVGELVLVSGLIVLVIVWLVGLIVLLFLFLLLCGVWLELEVCFGCLFNLACWLLKLICVLF